MMRGILYSSARCRVQFATRLAVFRDEVYTWLAVPASAELWDAKIHRGKTNHLSMDGLYFCCDGVRLRRTFMNTSTLCLARLCQKHKLLDVGKVAKPPHLTLVGDQVGQ